MTDNPLEDNLPEDIIRMIGRGGPSANKMDLNQLICDIMEKAGAEDPMNLSEEEVGKLNEIVEGFGDAMLMASAVIQKSHSPELLASLRRRARRGSG